MTAPELNESFHKAMLGIYQAALCLKPPYRATYFLNMVNEMGGVEAANRLLAANKVSDGFTNLYLRGPENLKLSVEYLVLKKPWRALFAEEQLEIARKRLISLNCDLPTEYE